MCNINREKNILVKEYKVILCLFMFFIFYSCSKDKLEPNYNTTLEFEVHIEINKYRLSKGLDSLHWNKQILQISRDHSYNMASEEVDFGHDGFDNRFEKLIGFFGSGGAAENVAKGQTSAQQVVNDWVNSEGHRKNIEGDYRITAIGIAINEKNENYFTQIFFK